MVASDWLAHLDYSEGYSCGAVARGNRFRDILTPYSSERVPWGISW
jgi:hypothetical protein